MMKNAFFLWGIFIISIVFLSCSKEEDKKESPKPTAGCFDQRTYTDQLPNMDFEEWGSPLESAGKYEEPCGGVWATGNGGVALSNLTTTTKTTDAQNGTFAAKMTTVLALGLISGGSIFAGEFELDLGNPANSALLGVPFSERPIGLKGYYKYLPVGGDSANIMVVLTKFNASSGRRDTIAYGAMPEKSAVDTYTEFNLTLDYNYPMGTATPDTIVVNFTSSKAAQEFKGQVGSTLFIDNCRFTY